MVHERDLRRASLTAALLLLAAAIPAAAIAKPQPSYALWETKWGELRAGHPEDPALILDQDTEYEVLTADYAPPVTNGRTAITMAVFDVGRAEEFLNREFTIPPGAKVKEVWAWSHELGASEVSWAQEKDFNRVALVGGWKQVRVSIPGLSKAGMCGVGIHTQIDGLPYVAEDFKSGLPLLRGEVRMVFPRIGKLDFDETTELIDRIYTPIILGPVEEIPPAVTHQGYSRVYRVKDIAPRPREGLTAAADLPRAEIQLVPSWLKWKAWIEYYDETLRAVPPPKSLVKAAQDTLSGAAPLDIVRAVARFVDDPAQFRLLGSARSANFSFPELQKVIDKKEGDAFDKAVLAHAVLRGLKVESHLVFAASRFRTLFDGRIPDPHLLDGVLLWIPALSADFVWDVADRSVPLGEAGADLYPVMVVCDPDASSYDRQFPLSGAGLSEERSLDLALDEDGALSGELSCRFAGWPMIDEMDPWRTGQDLTALLQEECPRGAKADSARWVGMDGASVRCTPEMPAILSCRLSAEAVPHGDNGWEIKPFYRSLPGPLASIHPDSRLYPVLLHRRVEVAESTLLRLDGPQAEALPARVRLDNKAGMFECSWERRAEGVLAQRRLRIPAQRAAGPQLNDLLALCRAWLDSRNSALLVE